MSGAWFLRPPAARPTAAPWATVNAPASEPEAIAPEPPPPPSATAIELDATRDALADKARLLAHAILEADALRGAIEAMKKRAEAAEARAEAKAREARDREAEHEGEIAELAIAVARRVVGKELATDPFHIVAWAREALEALHGEGAASVALAPDLSAELPSEVIAELGSLGATAIDPSLAPGACEVRRGPHAVAADAGARVDAVAESLAREAA